MKDEQAYKAAGDNLLHEDITQLRRQLAAMTAERDELKRRVEVLAEALDMAGRPICWAPGRFEIGTECPFDNHCGICAYAIAEAEQGGEKK